MGISNDVLVILQLLLGVIAWFVKRDLTEILHQVKKTNDRVTRLEQQATDHNILDTTRFDSLEKTLNRIEKRP